jgi:predicted ATPase/DNA-binding winged helix-turn-helix (wHTH) protein
MLARQEPGGAMTDRYRFANGEVRLAERQLLIDGAPIALGGRAFDVLATLIERHDRIVDKNELFEIVWPGLVVEENNLQVQVSSLRKLLGPNTIATVPGRGYRFVAPLVAESDPAAGRGATSRPPNNLPQLRTHFIGRERALDDCAGLLKSTRLLTLSGIGGCGKTRLAQEVAQRQLASFPDGVWFVDLGPLMEAQRVSATLAATLGVKNASDGSLARISAHVADRRALIVLDNCEHVIDAAVDSIDALLQGGSEVKVLATSREALGMSGEQIFMVRSLSLPASAELEEIRRSEAVRLFVDHARMVLPEFTVDERNASAIADICRRLDGIALAIELAAARVRVLSLDEIRSRLSDRFRLLTGGQRAMPRHQTLHAAMQWSHDLLTAREQRLFRRLAVFSGGCTLAAATDVIGDGGDEYDTLERLTALHDKSLVFVDRDTHAQPRYRMLETVRQYALERLNEAGEGDDVRDRHLLHYVALAERISPELTRRQQAEWHALLQQEQDNVLAAHAWCTNARQGGELALRLCADLIRYWYSGAQHTVYLRIAEEALRLAGPEGNPRHRSTTLWGMGYCACRLGRYDEAMGYAQASVAAAQAAGDAGLVVRCRTLVGGLLQSTGRLEEALSEVTNVCELADSTDNPEAQSAAANVLAELYRGRGDLVRASALYERAVTLTRERGDLRGLVIGLSNLVCALIDRGEYARARAVYAECVDTMDALGSTIGGMCCTLDVAGALATALGFEETAMRFHGAGRARLVATGMQHEPLDADFIMRWKARARARLDPIACDAAEAAGRSLPYEAALAEIRRWYATTEEAPAAATVT